MYGLMAYKDLWDYLLPLSGLKLLLFCEREAEKMKLSAGPPKLPSLHEDVTMY